MRLSPCPKLEREKSPCVSNKKSDAFERRRLLGVILGPFVLFSFFFFFFSTRREWYVEPREGQAGFSGYESFGMRVAL